MWQALCWDLGIKKIKRPVSSLKELHAKREREAYARQFYDRGRQLERREELNLPCQVVLGIEGQEIMCKLPPKFVASDIYHSFCASGVWAWCDGVVFAPSSL